MSSIGPDDQIRNAAPQQNTRIPSEAPQNPDPVVSMQQTAIGHAYDQAHSGLDAYMQSLQGKTFTSQDYNNYIQLHNLEKTLHVDSTTLIHSEHPEEIVQELNNEISSVNQFLPSNAQITPIFPS